MILELQIVSWHETRKTKTNIINTTYISFIYLYPEIPKWQFYLQLIFFPVTHPYNIL